MKKKRFIKFSNKAIIMILLTAFFSVGLLVISSQSVSAAQFNDTSGHWAESYINNAVSMGIVNGYTDGSFKPNDSVTRAEFAGMVNRTLGNRGTSYITFPDVYSTSWFYNDIAKAVSATYVSGYADGLFRPNDPISRQEASLMLARIVPAGYNDANLRNYPDSNLIASWSYDSMERICGKGYLGAYKNDNKLHPTAPLTRAQTAKILCDLKEKENIVSSDPIVKSRDNTLSNRIYVNNVTIHKDLGNSSAYLENCTVLGSLNIEGGGSNTVSLSNTRVANCSVNKDNSTVRVLTKGETTISNLSVSKDSILQTSGLSGGELGKGFARVSLKSSSDVTLRGSFASVTIDGSNADLLLDSGIIEKLIVSSSGSSADITIPRGTTVTSSEVNASCAFDGRGTIDYMRVNANGVTYEDKPKSISLASNISIGDDDDDYYDGVRFDPSNSEEDVSLNTDITLTFETSMELENGKSISNSDIDDFITLRIDRSNGSSVGFTGTINSSRKIITISPKSKLEDDTRYYVIVDRDSIRDDDGDSNSSMQIYFDTGDSTSSSSDKPFFPEDGASSVPLDTEILLNFTDEVIRYNNGETLSTYDSYLEECVELRYNGSSGEKIPFSAKISSSKETITIEPDSYLEANKTYYVGIVKNRLKSGVDGEVIPAKGSTWQTADFPLLSDFKASATGNNYTDVLGSSNVGGILYVIAVEGTGGGAPTPEQIAGKRNSNGIITFGNSASILSGRSASIRISGLNVETFYTFYGVIKDNAGNYSNVLSTTSTTAQGYMSSLSIKGMTGLSFSPTKQNYGDDGTRLIVPEGATELEVRASGSSNAVIKVNGVPVASNVATKIEMPTADVDTGMMELVIEYQSAPGKKIVLYEVRFYERKSVKLSSIWVQVEKEDPANFTANYLESNVLVSINIGTGSSITMDIVGTDVGTDIEINLKTTSGERLLASKRVTGGGPVLLNFSLKNEHFNNDKSLVDVILSVDDGGNILSKTFKFEFERTPIAP